MNLDLEPRDRDVLTQVLRDAISDLRMEIADTDSMDMREELKSREDLLNRVVRQLSGAAAEADPNADFSARRNAPRP